MSVFRLFCCVVLLASSSFVTSSPVAQADTTIVTSVLSSVGVDPSLANLTSTRGKIGNPQFTCQVLETLFPRNSTFTASSTYYTPLSEVPWSETCWLDPACVVTPKSANDLSKIVKVLTGLKTKFASRSGGHFLAPGFSSVGSDGVLIALQDLTKLSMSSDRKIATIGTGNRLRDAYAFAGNYNMTVVGGREPMVGVGGFLLGGGLSFFYNNYGLGLDNVARYQVVLMDGRIVDATPTQNSDLYKALKGGMANFGIITEFDLMTKPDFFNMYYEVSLYRPEDTPALLTAYANYTANETDMDSTVQLQVNAGYSLAFYGYKGQANSPVAFTPFRSIPVMQALIPPTNGTVTGLLFSSNGSPSDTTSEVGSAFSHKIVDAKFLLESYQTYLNAVATLPAGFNLTYVPQGVSTNLVRAGRANNGGNVLGLSEVPQCWVDIFMVFPQPSQAGQATAIIDNIIKTLSQKASADGIFLPYIYPNNASPEQKPLRGFGADNFAFIKKVAEKYDPKGYMQTLQNDGFLISNS